MSGTATSPNTTSRCRAGGSTCSTSPSCSRSATWSWYPGFGSFAGTSGWTSPSEHMPRSHARKRCCRRPSRPTGPADRRDRADPQALALGRSIFGNNCATCHGSSAKGAWLPQPHRQVGSGAAPGQVLETVLNGRQGVMPPWGTVLTGMGGAGAVDQRRVPTCASSARRPMPALPRGTAARSCTKASAWPATADGKGNPLLGAPDLTDGYWLYGDTTESMRTSIANGTPWRDAGHRADSRRHPCAPGRSLCLVAVARRFAGRQQRGRAMTDFTSRVRPPAAPDGAAGRGDPLAELLRRGRRDDGVLRLRRSPAAARHDLPRHADPANWATRSASFMFWTATASSSLFTWILLRPASRFNRAARRTD
jgi:mono/diheme cytochrome c family protein